MASVLAARARRRAPTIPLGSTGSSAGAPPTLLESTDFSCMPARMLARRSPRPSATGGGLFSLDGGGGGRFDPPGPPELGAGPPTGGGGGGGGPPEMEWKVNVH